MTGTRRIAQPRAGASDGTTPLSWKIVTTANCSYSMPFETQPIVHLERDADAADGDGGGDMGRRGVADGQRDILEVEYLGDGSSPLATLVNDGKANLLAAAAAQTASAASWSGINNTATWDPATVTAVNLSGGNLVATDAGTSSIDQGARGASECRQDHRQVYFKITFTDIPTAAATYGRGYRQHSGGYSTLRSQWRPDGVRIYVSGASGLMGHAASLDIKPVGDVMMAKLSGWHSI